jgi:chromosome condensin MukBEF ATPase and DNA-binding subunit MukB
LRELIRRQQDDIDRLNTRIHQQEEELAQARQRAEKAEIRAMSAQTS